MACLKPRHGHSQSRVINALCSLCRHGTVVPITQLAQHVPQRRGGRISIPRLDAALGQLRQHIEHRFAGQAAIASQTLLEQLVMVVVRFVVIERG